MSIRRWMPVLLALLVAWPAKADWLTDVARILGITKTPSAQRGAEKAMPGGDVMVVPLAGGEPKALTRGGVYRSPIVLPDGAVLALKADDLVRIPTDGGTPVTLRALPGAVKLLGADRSDPGRVAFLAQSAPGGTLALVTLATGTVALQPHDPKSKADLRLINHLRGESREYDGVFIDTRVESRDSVEWTEVYAGRGDAPPVKLSKCDGYSCVQPSLSPDGRQVVYIRSAR